MKKIIIGTMALTAGLLLTGCGENAPKEESAKVESAPKEKRAPECGSNDVKNMIIDGFTTKSIEEREKRIKNNIENCKSSIRRNKKNIQKYPGDKTYQKYLYESRKALAENEAALKKGAVSNNFNLKRILTESVDDRAQKSVCKAELHATTGGKHYIWDLDYTAQYTSDGELIIDMKPFKNYNLDWIFRVKSVTDVTPEKRASHNVESDENNIIKQKKTVNNKETKSNNTVSNTPQSSADTDQPGMHLISKDDLWTMILLVGEKESCEIGVKWNGNLLTYGGVGTACVFMTNSRNTDIYCTPKKSICKTEKEIFDFAQ